MLGMRESPLHILTASSSGRNRSKRVVCHVLSQPMPAGSFVKVGKNLYVASPELTFFLMASQLPIPELTLVGYELCGYYRLSNDAPSGFVKARPVSSAAKLLAFTNRMQGFAGVKKARRAAEFLSDRSASPRETVTAALLCLPHAEGGYGLEIPQMNREVQIKEVTPAGSVAKTLYCDLYWPQHRLAVEYDSDRHHAAPRNIAHDSKRRSTLGRAGVYVVSMTNDRLKSVRDFDEAARLLAKHTGRRVRVRRDDFPARRLRLRTTLLAQPRR